MLITFKRFFLLTLLTLTGFAAIIIALAIFRSGRSPESLTSAVNCAIGEGALLVASFAAYTAVDRPRLRTLSLFGMVLAALMLLLMPIYVWWEITDRLRLTHINYLAHARMESLAETGLMTAILLCLIPFIMIPRMKRVSRIIQFTTVLYLTVAYFTTLLQVWRIGGQRVEDVVIALLIPAGACMMGVFVLHKFFEIRVPDPLTSVGPVVHLRCPRCQSDQSLSLGESRCSNCRLKITIAVEEPKCPNCRFNLHGLTRPICPQCGLHLHEEDVPGENAKITIPHPT